MMKKLLATWATLIVLSTSAQVTFTVTAPASIAGGYDFTSNGDGTDWGLPNLLNPNDAVLDTLMLVDDGTPGLNAQGIPLANEGCGTLQNDLTGKIAVVYRYDGVSSNVCWYGTKVLNAQNAGAIGVVMINREDGLIDVPGTTDGPLTNIPFVFISKSDGEILRARMDAGDDVVAFIGNKMGLYNADAGIVKANTLIPSISATSTLLTQSSNEFGFDAGSMIYNYGSNNLSGVQLSATVTGPGGTWTETAGPFNINSGDSVDGVFPAFSLSSYPPGWYNLTYDLDLGIPDEAPFDNQLSFDFVLTDSVISYARLDPLTNLPRSTYQTRASSSAPFASCMAFDDPNASRIAVDGFYFTSYVLWSSAAPSTGEELELSLYKWEDVFTDLNDPNFGFSSLNPLSYGYYIYPADLQGETVYGALEFPVQLEDNQRYLACVQTANPEIWMGFDNGLNYTRNIAHYLQAQNPVLADGAFYALGFGEKLTSTVSLSVFDASTMSVNANELKAFVYPNPATEHVAIVLSRVSTGKVSVLDLAGKLVIEDEIVNDDRINLTVGHLNPGMYTIVFLGDADNGSFTFVKK